MCLKEETLQMRKRRIVVSRSEQPNASEILGLLRSRSLTARQRQVLDCRSQNLSYAEVGRQLSISAERVRQIEARLRTMARLLSQEPP
jgi:DNA-binding CsgD family transcriptional regulator